MFLLLFFWLVFHVLSFSCILTMSVVLPLTVLANFQKDISGYWKRETKITPTSHRNWNIQFSSRKKGQLISLKLEFCPFMMCCCLCLAVYLACVGSLFFDLILISILIAVFLFTLLFPFQLRFSDNLMNIFIGNWTRFCKIYKLFVSFGLMV